MAKRVLIVEDEILVALDLEDSLSRAGYDVVGIAADRNEALSLAARAEVALVDLNLRDGATGLATGMTLAEEHGVRVLFLTANPASVRGDLAGIAGCLGKPCEPASICAAIEFAAGRLKPDSVPRELIRFS